MVLPSVARVWCRNCPREGDYGADKEVQTHAEAANVRSACMVVLSVMDIYLEKRWQADREVHGRCTH